MFLHNLCCLGVTTLTVSIGFGSYFRYKYMNRNFSIWWCLSSSKLSEIAKKLNIKNRTYYFFNDVINIKDFDWSLLKIDKKPYKNIGTYNIGYITIIIKIIIDYENIQSVNLLYLMIGKIIGHVEEKMKISIWVLVQRSCTQHMKTKKY